MEIRKVFSGTVAGESSRPPRPLPTETSCKEKPLSEVKTLFPQRSEKEPIAETSGATLPVEVLVAKLLEVTPIPLASRIPKEKRSASAELSPRKGKKKKESSPEEEELEETSREIGSSTERTGSEKVTSPPETKRINARSSDRKRPLSEPKTPAVSKKHQKSSGKGGSL